MTLDRKSRTITDVRSVINGTNELGLSRDGPDSNRARAKDLISIPARWDDKDRGGGYAVSPVWGELSI